MFNNLVAILNKNSYFITSLGNRTNFHVRSDNNVIEIRNSRKKIYIINENDFNHILERYNSLELDRKWIASEYTPPKWMDCNKKIVSPYVASLIRYYNKNLVDKKEIKKLYTIYLNYCRNNQWDVEFISNYLKKSEDKFQNYYNEYNQEEFEEMIKESAIFKKRWGQI